MNNPKHLAEKRYHSFAGFSSICIGTVLLYPLDQCVFQAVNFYGENIKTISMVGVVLVMNHLMLFELFIFILMAFKFLRNCFKAGLKVTFDSIQGNNYSDYMMRLLIVVFTFLSFLGTASALSYSTLNLFNSVVCVFFSGLIFPAAYYILNRYQTKYKNKSCSLLFIMQSEFGFLSISWIWVISSALAVTARSKLADLRLAIGLTVLILFIVLLIAKHANNYLESKYVKKRLQEFKQIEMLQRC